jgi:imidazolonepropionase
MTMPTLVLRDIGELLTLTGPDALPVARGADPQTAVAAAEAALGVVHDATVVLAAGRVLYAGPAAGAPRELPGEVTVCSAGGRLVSPGLVDAHTHLLFAGERSREFDLRNLGAGYGAIQQAGGGILATVRATAAASDHALLELLRARLQRALSLGTTLCEVKTGYGLWPAAELRLLALIKTVAASAGPELLPAVSPTLLCHVPPKELGGPDAPDRQRLVQELGAAASLAALAGAQALDVYCDHGAFTFAEADQLLRAGRAAGLLLRCHAEQFTFTGVAQRAAELGAASVEHLEHLDEAGVRALADAGVVANLLPGAALTLRLPWPDARRLIHAGVAVALASDCNPGSSYSESLPLMMTLACTQLGLSCAEAWLGVTRHAARALRHDAGRLASGSPGDLVVWEADHYRQVCQHMGVPLVAAVFRAGVLASGQLPDR